MKGLFHLLYVTRAMSVTRNIAVLFIAFLLTNTPFDTSGAWLFIQVLVAMTLVCSAFYAYNSFTDQQIDTKNTNKKHYSTSVNYFGNALTAIIFFLFISGLMIGYSIHWKVALSLFFLFLSVFFYSAPFSRFKEKFFLDVLFGAFLTFSLRFLAGWYAFSSLCLPILVFIAFGLFQSGMYLLYKELDREYLISVGIKNSITLQKRSHNIFLAACLLVATYFSMLIMVFNAGKYQCLGSISPATFWFVIALSVPVFFVNYLQAKKITRIKFKIIRRFGLAFIFLTTIIYMYYVS